MMTVFREKNEKNNFNKFLNSITKDKTLFFVIFFKMLLDIVYATIILPRYDYFSITLNISAVKVLESYIYLIILFLLLRGINTKRISFIALYTIYLVMIIPILSMYGMNSEIRGNLLIILTGYTLSLTLVKVIRIKSLPNVFRLFKNHKAVSLNKILGLITIITYFSIFYFNGFFSFDALDFSVVYEVRSEFSSNTIITYLMHWQGYVINNYFLVENVYRGKYNRAVTFSLLQLVLFLYTGHKSFIFSPFVVLSVYFILNSIDFKRIAAGLLIGLNFFAAMFYTLGVTQWLISLVTYRNHFMTAQINYYFFDFFNNNPLLLFSEGQIGRLLNISSPYDSSIFYLIGELYFERGSMHANTWYIADAYSNLGFGGVIVFSILLALILVFVDKLNIDLRFKAAIISMPFLTILNTSLLTAMVTNGLFICIVILYMKHCELEVDSDNLVDNRNVYMILTNGFDPDPRVYKEAQSLIKLGYSVEILSWDRENKYLHKPEEILNEIKIRRFFPKSEYGSGLKQIKNLNTFKGQVKKYLSSKQIRYLHCHDFDALVVGASIIKQHPNSKLVFDEHDYFYSYFKNRGGLKNVIISILIKIWQRYITNNFVDTKIVVTPKMKEIDYSNVEIKVINNAPLKRTFSDNEKIKSDRIRIGFVGNLRYEKEIFYLIDEVGNNEAFEIFLAGGGTKLTQIKEYVENNNVNNVIFYGQFNQSELENLYKRIDITYLIYPLSDSIISLPNKYFESMITGTPIITRIEAEIGGVVSGGNYGWTIDSSFFSESLKSIISNLSKKEILSKRQNILQNSNDVFWEDNDIILMEIYNVEEKANE